MKYGAEKVKNCKRHSNVGFRIPLIGDINNAFRYVQDYNDKSIDMRCECLMEVREV
jgi:hypothetical protein